MTGKKAANICGIISTAPQARQLWSARKSAGENILTNVMFSVDGFKKKASNRHEVRNPNPPMGIEPAKLYSAMNIKVMLFNPTVTRLSSDRNLL